MGAYRIADRLDFAAARRHPTLMIGFSEITFLHSALLKFAGLPGIHGAAWDAATFGTASATSFVRAVTAAEPVIVSAFEHEPTFALSSHGRASGPLIGGNQDAIATAAGWALPDLDGAILLLEAVGLRVGHIDRQLTMLMNTGAISGAGVALGQYTNCGSATEPPGAPAFACTKIDVLRDRLTRLGVPILGGLPIGHGLQALAIPVGTQAVMDVAAGTLVIEPAVS